MTRRSSSGRISAGVAVAVFGSLTLIPAAAWASATPVVSGTDVAFSPSTVALSDGFDGAAVSSDLWHIPTWRGNGDGTYVGRTQFRCSQNSPLPTASGGDANITVQTYNPTGSSFYGTELISNTSFTVGSGVSVIVRAKMSSPAPQGMVGGIFLYDLKPGSSTLHDEIDFEFLGNDPTHVHTNTYANEPLGAGHPEAAAYASGSISDYHTYRIDWLPTSVSWYVDEQLIRTSTSNVPTGPMHLHLNMWAPASDWSEAYYAGIQSVTTAGANSVFTMSVDSVSVAPTAVVTQVERYIQRVYEDLFNREPDPTGLATWRFALLNGTPRVAVANGITYSTEYRMGLIAGSYQRYLGRGPDPVGMQNWLSAMASGLTVSQMESGFIASAEYYARAGSTADAWVTKLYADVLGRAAGPAEVAFWTGQLARGASHSQVAMGFLLSTEHLNTVVTGYYQDLLGRGLDPTGQGTWVAILQAGGRNEGIIGGIIASEEYWNNAIA